LTEALGDVLPVHASMSAAIRADFIKELSISEPVRSVLPMQGRQVSFHSKHSRLQNNLQNRAQPLTPSLVNGPRRHEARCVPTLARLRAQSRGNMGLKLTSLRQVPIRGHR
jgi:hypothetical protein